MNPSIVVGQLLLWSGFLSGALAAVFSLENEVNQWATVNWTWYLVSCAVCAAGIVFLRFGKKIAAGDSEASQADFATLPVYLSDALHGVREVQKQQYTLPPSQIVQLIDDQCGDGLREFADARETMITQRGLQDYADIMTQFAAGERAIHRAWSSAADGYLDETETCLERAGIFLQNALDMLGGEPEGYAESRRGGNDFDSPNAPGDAASAEDPYRSPHG